MKISQQRDLIKVKLEMVSVYINMSLVMLALSIFLLSARYDLPDYQGEHDLLLYYESIDIFLPLHFIAWFQLLSFFTGHLILEMVEPQSVSEY